MFCVQRTLLLLKKYILHYQTTKNAVMLKGVNMMMILLNFDFQLTSLKYFHSIMNHYDCNNSNVVYSIFKEKITQETSKKRLLLMFNNVTCYRPIK